MCYIDVQQSFKNQNNNTSRQKILLRIKLLAKIFPSLRENTTFEGTGDIDISVDACFEDSVNSQKTVMNILKLKLSSSQIKNVISTMREDRYECLCKVT